MPVIGIDPGTKCGWCVRHDGGGMDSGTWNLKGGRFEGGGMRFLRMRQHIAELLDTVKPGMLAFEEVRRHQGVDAAHIYGGIIAVITEECERRSIPYSASIILQLEADSASCTYTGSDLQFVVGNTL